MGIAMNVRSTGFWNTATVHMSAHLMNVHKIGIFERSRKMNKKLTKQEAIANHRKMWRWIAKETEKQRRIVGKGEYFKSIRIKLFDVYNVPSCQCYCCEYDTQYYDTCEFCPMDWGSEVMAYMCNHKKYDGDRNGLFAQWSDTTSWQEAARLARAIAELDESYKY